MKELIIGVVIYCVGTWLYIALVNLITAIGTLVNKEGIDAQYMRDAVYSIVTAPFSAPFIFGFALAVALTNIFYRDD